MALFVMLDYCVLFGVMLASVIVGLFFAWTDRKKSNEEFLAGGRNMGVFPVVLSLMASYLTAQTFIGWPVEVYTKGTQLFMAIFAPFVSTTVAAEVFIPIYYKINAISVNKYLLKRFDSRPLMVTTSIIMTISRIPSLGIILFSPALAFGVATGMSTTTCILVTAAVATLYTSLGGLKAVIYTDVIQMFLMIAGLLVILTKGTLSIGGIGEVLERNNQGGRIQLFNLDFNLYMSNNLWTVLIGTSFVYTAAYSTDQLAVQRSITLPSIARAKKALYLVMFGLTIFNILVLYFGMVIYAHYYKCDPSKSGQITRIDEIVTLYVGQIFSDSLPGLLGLFVTCIFCSSLSTVSAGLNAVSALVWEDCLKSSFKNASRVTTILITKGISIITGLVVVACAFLAMNIGTIFEASFILVGAPIGPLFGLYFLGVYFPNVNAIGAVSGLISGQIISILIVTGSMINKISPEVQTTLYTSTDSCTKLFPGNSTSGFPFESLKNSSIPNYEPQGWQRLFHLNALFIPFIAFAVTLIIGNVVSVIFGNNHGKKIDQNLLAKCVRRNEKSDKSFALNSVCNQELMSL